MTETRRRPLWLKRNVLNGTDVLRWALTVGLPRMVEPDHLHFTVATARGRVDWSLIDPLHTDVIEIEAGSKPVIGLGTQAWALGFPSTEALDKRFVEVSQVFSVDFAESFLPHVTLCRGDDPGPLAPYEGRLILGPEIAEPFMAGMTFPRGNPINRKKYRAMVGLDPIDEERVKREEHLAGRDARRRDALASRAKQLKGVR